MNGAQFVAQALAQEGTRYVFGLCGHTNLALLDALAYETDIEFISVRHEQVAAHAADGYARVTGQPGILLLHVGPGMTNAITGVATAALDSIPLVVLAGDIQNYFDGYGPHQEVKYHADGAQWEIYRPFVKRAWRLHSPCQFPDVLCRAFNEATSGRPGPVLIDVPMNLFSAPVDAELPILAQRRPATARSIADLASVEEAVRLLVKSARPVIYAGGGVITSDAASALMSVAERLAIPVATSLLGKGSVSEDHPLAFGMTGLFGTPAANKATLEADVILAVGTRFAEMDSSSWRPGYTFNIPPTKLIHLDIDPAEIGRIYPVQVPLLGDARATLLVLHEALGGTAERRQVESPWWCELDSVRREWLARIGGPHQSSEKPIRPERILGELRRALPKDGIIVTDVGWNKNGVGQQFPIYLPRTHLTPSGMATMGFGPAAALGARLGRPDCAVVALVGDGAFSSVSSAVCSAVENNVPVVWVVMNNYSYGVITGMQRALLKRTTGTEFIRRDTAELYNPNFAALATAYGAGGERIEDPGDLEPALTRALESGRPYVLDVIMNRQVGVPMTGLWDVNELLRRS
jgi:acetolactate synthase-1/2/3 large subunit